MMPGDNRRRVLQLTPAVREAIDWVLQRRTRRYGEGERPAFARKSSMREEPLGLVSALGDTR